MHFESAADPWQDATGSKWKIQLHWQVINSRAECIGVRIASAAKPDDPLSAGLPKVGVPVTTALLRGIPLGAQIEAQRREINRFWALAPAQPEGVFKRPIRLATLARLQEAAAVYSAAWRNGDAPTAAVEDHFGISHSAAAKLVSRARDADLLPKTAKGRASGGTPKPRKGSR
jgi:hypothetical protein